MSANVESMAYAGEKPWHGLGTAVPGELSVDEMLKAAKLDWTVSKRPAHVWDNNEETMLKSSQWNLLVRDSDEMIFGPCGQDYVPVQNREAFSFFNKFVEAGHMTMETAGSLDNGRQVWGLAKMKEGFKLPGNDEVEGHLLVSQPHIWGKAAVIMFTPIRVVCSNTLTMALRSGKKRFRHTHVRAFDAAVQRDAEIAIGISKELLDTFKEKATILSKKRYTEQDYQRFIARLFQPAAAMAENPLAEFKDTASNAYSAINRQPRIKQTEGTWWDAFNGVTFYADHEAGRDRDTSLHRAWFGDRATLKREALEIAVEYATTSKSN